MNSIVELVLYLIFLHWVADFIFQTDWQAKNKSSNWAALSKHVLTYTATMGVGISLYIENRVGVDFENVWQFVLMWTVLNGALHFATDMVTSRINSRLWEKGQVHNFFVSVGFDQVLHYFALIFTFFWLLGV